MKLSVKDKSAIASLMIAQTGMVNFIDIIEESVKFKNDDGTKNAFIEFLKQGDELLKKMDEVGDKLIEGMSNPEIKKIINKSVQYMKLLDTEKGRE